MNADYKVGDLIYDANIYDGLNTFLSDLQFYKKWLPENKDDRRILELCCGTGRLTLPIAKDGYNICGVDYTSSMLEQAKAKASEAGLEINFIEADIRTLNLQEKFDFIFLDAAKGQYPLFLKECLRLLEKGGILVCDNVLFNGRVVTKIPDIRRNKTIINRLSSFLEDLESELSVKTVILPISDGVTVSVKEECTDEKALP